MLQLFYTLVRYIIELMLLLSYLMPFYEADECLIKVLCKGRRFIGSRKLLMEFLNCGLAVDHLLEKIDQSSVFRYFNISQFSQMAHRY